MIIYLYALGFWFLLLILAIINGLIREKVYKKRFGDSTAHQIGTFSFIIIILLTSNIFVNHTGFKFTDLSLFLIGLIWLLLTILFEFIFGHYIMKNSWKKLLADYNILKGRLWVLVLFFTLVSPWIVKRFS